MCSFSYFGKMREVKKKFNFFKKFSKLFHRKVYYKRKTRSSTQTCQWYELETFDNKIHELSFTRVNKEKKMNILDFVIIRGQQVF